MKPKAILLGAGGHAKVIIDILQENGEFELSGCLSRSPASGSVLGIPILGTEDLLPELLHQGIQHSFVAIGDNGVRQRLFRQLTQAGFLLLNAVSRHSVLSPHVTLGRGVAIMPGAVINVDSRLGDGAIINTGATVDHECVIGEFAHLGPGVNLCGTVHIGEGTLLGVGCHVIPGKIVGPWSVVGAGSVVVRDLPDGCTAMGNPARVKL